MDVAVFQQNFIYKTRRGIVFGLGQFWPTPVLEETFLLRERTNCCSSYLSPLRKRHNPWLYFDGINSIYHTWEYCFDLYQVTQKTSSFDSCLCSVMPDSLQPYGLQLTRLPCPWDFPGKNTQVGCHFLLHWFDQDHGKEGLAADLGCDASRSGVLAI